MGEKGLPQVIVTNEALVLSPGADEKGALLSPNDDPEKAIDGDEREQWKDPVQVNKDEKSQNIIFIQNFKFLVFHDFPWILCWTGQYLEISISVSAKWRRFIF